MASKNVSAPEALVTVVAALEPLSEQDRAWVLQSAASRWSISVPNANSPNDGSTNSLGGSAPAGINVSPAGQNDAQVAISKNDVRSFIRFKKPASDVERVACLVYFLSKTTTQHGFTSQLISTTHTESGGSAINMPRALDNATRRAKYISNRSAKEKQMTPLGEDVVEALPNRDAVAAIISEARKRTPRKKAGKIPKKKN